MALSMMKKYEIAMKHAKKFAAKPSSLREVLKGVYHNPNGSVEITDSYKLLRIQGAHSLSEPKLVNVKTGEEMDYKYPDVERVIPTEFELTFEIDGQDAVKTAFERVKLAYSVAKSVDKSKPLAYIEISDEAKIVVDEECVYYSAILQPNTYVNDGFKACFNAEYLHDAMNVFKDAETKKLSFKFPGELEPALITDEENGIDVVILPIRTN